LDALKLAAPDELLPALLAEIRRLATRQKSNLTDAELKRLVAQFRKQHGLPDL
jgi:hypothetical protein